MSNENKSRTLNVALIAILMIFLGVLVFVSLNSTDVNNTILINNSEQCVKIDINKASLKELTSLPGIGNVKGERIILNRPYENISNLLNILTEAQFDKIKNEVMIE